jgi:sugar phosphate isomerase/epimerase
METYRQISAGRKYFFLILLIGGLLVSAPSCTNVEKSKESSEMIFARENLVAWCIIPFDAMKRNPKERAEMLNELGITKMAWDWRMEHIAQLPEEIQVLRDHDIELTAVWFWIDRDLEEGMLPHQEQILQTLEESKTQTTIWVSFSDHFFDDYDEAGKLDKAVRNIAILNDRAEKLGCRVALYNHMHWFGEPENQVKIIKALGSENVGIVYNFHHGHHHIDNWPEYLELMLPYLWTININGMNPEGPKTLDIGKGRREKEMLQAILDSGFNGTIGILGHTDGEDIRVVLERNLDGLKVILKDLGEETALATYN